MPADLRAMPKVRPVVPRGASGLRAWLAMQTSAATLIQLHRVMSERDDPVCRCGHGFTVHRLRGEREARDCAACAASVAVGNRPPSGSSCHAFVQ